MSTLDYPRIPYGWADFRAMRLEGRLYVDKTRFLRPLEDERFVFLIRPRRFGKSCWLSLLENYYDRKWASEFEQVFGTLDIGRDPTENRHSFVTLRFDFSAGARRAGDAGARVRVLLRRCDPALDGAPSGPVSAAGSASASRPRLPPRPSCTACLGTPPSMTFGSTCSSTSTTTSPIPSWPTTVPTPTTSSPTAAGSTATSLLP